MLEIRPIVVNDDMIVLGGNMRLKACKEAGLKEVPIIKASDLTEDEQKQFIIKDNVSGGEWDWEMLQNDWNLEELDEWGLDVPDFTPVQVLEAEEDDFDTTPPEEPKTVLGDLYEIGEHRLLCGDSTDSDQVAKLMNGSKADMVFTDPPYGMNLNTNYADIHKNHIGEAKNQNKIIGDDKDFNFLDFYALFEYVKEQFWWGADYYKNEIPKEGCFLVWDKTLGEHKERIGNEFEICWSKQTHKKVIDRIKWVGFVGIKKDDGKRKHPSQKPIELCCRYLNDYSKEKNIIVDLFIGSGSTMVASHQIKRKCYGMELDPKYCDVIVKRMITLDPTLTIKRNGVDVTNEWK
jgi:site-specific DNA-methyltransferase (adenine-specific)